jgi:CspA family cold shock protein
MSSYTHVVTPSETSEHLLGRVKWFNNKTGYGFITVTDGERSGNDVFVHHSAINVDSQQYKYLVQGEYVEFNLIKVESDKHQWQASSVSGIRNGKLMCETRRDLKVARNEYKATKIGEDPIVRDESRMPRQKVDEQKQIINKITTERKINAPRVRSGEPRDGDKKEWTLVVDKAKNLVRKPRSSVKTTNN